MSLWDAFCSLDEAEWVTTLGLLQMILVWVKEAFKRRFSKEGLLMMKKSELWMKQSRSSFLQEPPVGMNLSENLAARESRNVSDRRRNLQIMVRDLKEVTTIQGKLHVETCLNPN